MVKKTVFLIVPAMYSGGQERVVSRLTEILQDIYDIKVVLFDDSIIDYPIYGDYVSLNLPSKKNRNSIMRSIYVMRRVLKLRKLAREHKPYAAVSFGGGANLVNVAACSRNWNNSNWNSIISVRGYAYLAELRGFKNLPKRLVFGKAYRIICVSQVMLEEMWGLLPGAREKLRLLYNAYDIDQINRLAGESTGIDDLFLNNEVIITVGTLDPIKGYLHLIKAFSLVKKNRDNAVLVHIGPDYYGYGKAVKELVCNLGLENHVFLLGYQDNPYRYIAKSRIFVLSSISEGFPNALVEAMACGIPVISSDCKTGPREILTASFSGDGSGEGDSYGDAAGVHTGGFTHLEFADFGVLVPPFIKEDTGDPNVIEPGQRILAQAIERLLGDEALRKNYADRARERAAFFSYERCKEEIVEIING